MDPETGTFTSMDTYSGSLSDPLSLHKYQFANCNPVEYCDPSGHFATLPEITVGQAIQAILASALTSVALDMVSAIENGEGYSFGRGLGAFLAGAAFAIASIALAYYGCYVLLLIIGAISSPLMIISGAYDFSEGHYFSGIYKMFLGFVGLYGTIKLASSLDAYYQELEYERDVCMNLIKIIQAEGTTLKPETMARTAAQTAIKTVAQTAIKTVVQTEIRMVDERLLDSEQKTFISN